MSGGKFELIGWLKMQDDGMRFECQRIGELLSPYLDGYVDDSERAFVERHLSNCAACARELQQLQVVVRTLKQLPTLPSPRSFALTRAQYRRDIMIERVGRAILGLAAILVVMFLAHAYFWIGASSSERVEVKMLQDFQFSGDVARDAAGGTKNAAEVWRGDKVAEDGGALGAPAAAPAPARAASGVEATASALSGGALTKNAGDEVGQGSADNKKPVAVTPAPRQDGLAPAVPSAVRTGVEDVQPSAVLFGVELVVAAVLVALGIVWLFLRRGVGLE